MEEIRWKPGTYDAWMLANPGTTAFTGKKFGSAGFFPKSLVQWPFHGLMFFSLENAKTFASNFGLEDREIYPCVMVIYSMFQDHVFDFEECDDPVPIYES
jgi:hypothetical protein